MAGEDCYSPESTWKMGVLHDMFQLASYYTKASPQVPVDNAPASDAERPVLVMPLSSLHLFAHLDLYVIARVNCMLQFVIWISSLPNTSVEIYGHHRFTTSWCFYSKTLWCWALYRCAPAKLFVMGFDYFTVTLWSADIQWLYYWTFWCFLGVNPSKQINSGYGWSKVLNICLL